MTTKEILDKVISSEKVRKLSISRVPPKTKELFIDVAKEFEDDYGLTLKWILEQALEYQDMKATFFENINMKLDQLLNNQPSTDVPKQREKKKMLSGKTIEYEKGVPNKWAD